jgi:hypothetical protein
VNYLDPWGTLVEVLARKVIGSTVHLLIRIYELNECGQEKTLATFEIFDSPPGVEPRLRINEPGTVDNHRNTGVRYPIKPPLGKAQKDFERDIIKKVINYDFPNYWATGPNSNTFVDNVIEGAGANIPNIKGAVGQNYGE